MSPSLVIMLLALNIGKWGEAHQPPVMPREAVRPVVTLTPNWRNILTGDSVTLTCHVTSAAPEEPTYHWYRDHQPISGDQQSIVIEHRGDYQCQTSPSDISPPVTLTVSNEHVIVQTPPPPIYEGDPLRCHHQAVYYAEHTRFYKDGEEIPSPVSELRIHTTHRSSNRTYKCTKLLYDYQYDRNFEASAVAHITVRELFPRPEIKVTPDRVIEGGEMTLTCDTRLDPLRRSTELYFAFYRNGGTVRGFNMSDTYRVPYTKLEDSGNYTCEVTTASGTVRKKSDLFMVEIQKKGILPWIVPSLAVAAVGVIVIIIISAVLIWRCKKRRSSPSHEEQLPATTATDPDPQDVCYTYLDIGSLNKAAQQARQAENDDMTVTYATVKKSRDI